MEKKRTAHDFSQIFEGLESDKSRVYMQPCEVVINTGRSHVIRAT